MQNEIGRLKTNARECNKGFAIKRCVEATSTHGVLAGDRANGKEKKEIEGGKQKSVRNMQKKTGESVVAERRRSAEMRRLQVSVKAASHSERLYIKSLF